MDSKKLTVPCLIFAIIVLAVGNVLQILYSKNIELRLENHLEKFAKFEVSCKDIIAKLLRDEAFSSVGRNPHNTKDHKSLQNNKHEGFEVRQPRKLSVSNVLHEELNKKVALPKGPPGVAVSNNGIIFPQLKGTIDPVYGNDESKEDHNIVKRAAAKNRNGRKKKRRCKRGQKGERGPKGENGDPGVKGKAGPQGNVGPRGPDGEKGDRGANGEKGGKGERGEKGEKGDSGKSPTSELIHLVGVGGDGSPMLDLTTAKTKEDARFKIWKTEAHHGGIRYANGYITIRVTGYYYVYCQIHYSGRFKFNRHVVKKNDREPILLGLETFKRPTHIFDKNASTKFTGGIFRLIQGDQISVFGIATKYTLHKGSTYFGAYLLYQ